MPWITERPPPPHRCGRPVPDIADLGRVWECDECGQRYRLVYERAHSCTAGTWSSDAPKFHWCRDV